MPRPNCVRQNVSLDFSSEEVEAYIQDESRVPLRWRIGRVTCGGVGRNLIEDGSRQPLEFSPLTQSVWCTDSESADERGTHGESDPSGAGQPSHPVPL